jgi:hypothetical protein
MGRFVEGADRGQATLLPDCLGDWIDEDNPVRAIDAFVDALDLTEMGFDGVEPAATGRPGYNPATRNALQDRSERALDEKRDEAGHNRPPSLSINPPELTPPRSHTTKTQNGSIGASA